MTARAQGLTVGLRRWLDERRTKAAGLGALVLLIPTQILSVSFEEANRELLRQLLPDGFVEDTVTSGVGENVPWLSLVLLTLAVVAWLGNWERLTRMTLFIAVSATTVLLVVQVITLLRLVPSYAGSEGGVRLLIDAAIVWTLNGVVFTLWYWLVDAGGPDRRGTSLELRPDFLFPQREADVHGWERWRPGFGDYLFVAFCVSSAFGGDTPALAWRAKFLVMGQAVLSLAVLVVFAARAIHIIGG